MKKLILFFVMGLFILSCSVEEEELLPAQQEFPTLDAVSSIPPGCPGDILNILCSSEINNPTVRGFTNYYRNLIFLNTHFTNITGTFEPSMAQLLEQYNAGEGIGTFTTTYTVDTDDCGLVTMDVTVEVNDCSAEPEPCLPNVSEELCLSQVNNATLNGFRSYFRGLVFTNTDLTTITGTFNPTIAQLYDQFNNSGPLGNYTTLYTVETEECGLTSMRLSVDVINCTQGEPSVCAEDIIDQLCVSEVNNPTLQGFKNYFRNLIFLNTDFTTITGSFNPTLENLYQEFLSSDGTGIFATNYSVNTPECGEITFAVSVEVEECN